MTLPPTAGGRPARAAPTPDGADPVASYSTLGVQQGTLPRAAIVGAGILALVAVGAWFGFSGDTAAPMDHYLRQGPANAAAALRRDMVAEFPAGSQVSPLIRRLEALGMACVLAAESRAQWDCAIMVRAETRRSVTLRATVGTFGDKVAAIDTAVSEKAQ